MMNRGDVLSSNKKKVTVEFFYSVTCPYCPAALKMVQEAKKLYPDDIEVFKIDTQSDFGQAQVQLYSIQGTPAIAINGKIVFRGVPPSQNALNGEIEKYLSEDAISKAKQIKKKRRDRMNLMYG